MPYRWISKSVSPLPLLHPPTRHQLHQNLPTPPKKKKNRYEIESGTTGWEDAEKQVDRLLHLSGDKGKKKKVEGSGDVTVSVRSGKKRKGGGGGDGDNKGVVEKIYNEEMGGGLKKKVKKDRGKDKDKGKR